MQANVKISSSSRSVKIWYDKTNDFEKSSIPILFLLSSLTIRFHNIDIDMNDQNKWDLERSFLRYQDYGHDEISLLSHSWRGGYTT